VSGRTIPVRYSPNAERLYWANDEFGRFAAILSDSFEEADAEALCILRDRDGDCDHGLTEDEFAAMDADAMVGFVDACDCSYSDDGPVWAIYLTLTATATTREAFEAEYGDDIERIPA
jgi:hypothetical protein